MWDSLQEVISLDLICWLICNRSLLYLSVCHSQTLLLRQSLAIHALQFLFFALCCPFGGATCQNVLVKVCGICPFYNLTKTSYNRSTATKFFYIFSHSFRPDVHHFHEVYFAQPCSNFFPHILFYMSRSLLCFYAACHHIFTAHGQ